MTSRFREEEIVPYPDTLAATPVATHCRGTLLLTSMQQLKTRGHYERYVKLLPPEHLATVAAAAASTWLPIDVGLTHYRACDGLGLPIEEMLAMGAAVVTDLQRTFLGTVVRAASSGAGIGPEVGLRKFGTVFTRSIQGGGARAVRVGPKDVRIEFKGLPFAAVRYFRVAYRGFIQAGCELFARRVVVAELAPYLSDTTLAYRVAWA